ncbi:MAG TPA: Holliday junction resolvase-like protein [Vicinamibacteria bacterium]|nr:Holliday junction resolvase-like protein [Vicinamibacteria bacterium]
MDESTLVIVLLAFAVFMLLWVLLRRIGNESSVRKDALRRSQAAVAGRATEQLAAYLREFPFDPRDARFLGSPIDFVVFDGLSDGDLDEIVFVEIKTGTEARLSARERRIRKAVMEGRVRFEEIRLPGPDRDD